MVALGARSGIAPLAPGAGWARPSGHAAGNDLPPPTGDLGPGYRPAPAPPGQIANGQLGANDGYLGADPGRPKVSPAPHVWAWGEGDPQDPDTGEGRQSYWRGGIQGFSDKLTVKDRHAYWDPGRTRSPGTTDPGNPGDMPVNPQKDGPPRPDLRLVNRTVSYQMGTDRTRNTDDLSRPYTWLGEQGSGWANVNGGVPGLYQPYGTRGGVPYPIVDPTEGEGGPADVWSGPPHGLHSLTYPDRGDTLDRYRALQQMQPGRVDRPLNSPQAGQSFSQTMQFQGFATGGASSAAASSAPGPLGGPTGRGWSGMRKV
jgi:hypothetical protein